MIVLRRKRERKTETEREREREREKIAKYKIRDTSHIIMRSCGTLVAAMTRADNHVDVILWSRVSPLMRETQVGSAYARIYTYVSMDVFYTPNVQKGDAEKCACGANGGECNATRTEPAAECSSEPNSEVASSLGYCARKQERRRGRKKERVGRERAHRELPRGPLSSRTRCRSASCRRYDPPSNRCRM